MLFLFRLNAWKNTLSCSAKKNGPTSREKSPPTGGSILMTSAP